VRTEADVLVTAASGQQALTQIVVYNIPGRDSGGYSAGGIGGSDNYRVWIDELATGIGRRQAIVILEPDALAQLLALNEVEQVQRLADLTYAVEVLTAHTQAFVYIDAGHSAWHTARDMAVWLQHAGVAKARGFALNVSNFQTTEAETAFGDELAQLLGGKRYVVDTSRNGQGPPPEQSGEWWINPAGRGLGAPPTTDPPQGKYVDAYLWAKTPGESDGDSGGAPPAGEWFPAYADMLIANARAN
jgi:endoglucanase